MSAPQCEYQITKLRRCTNPARWLIDYLQPAESDKMRTRKQEHRCHWHEPEKFFPEGSSQFVTRLPASSLSSASESEKP